MKLLFHFAYTNFSNTYVVGPEKPGNALIIDPGVIDNQLLHLIEHHGYYIKYIFATHLHHGHISGIGTLLKIYQAQLYSGSDSILGYPAHRLQHGDKVDLEEIEVDVIGLPGHTGDSLGYIIENMIFSGDALAAGTIGETIHSYAGDVNKDAIRRRILSQDDTALIFPGHGPPSSVNIEKRFNPFLNAATT